MRRLTPVLSAAVLVASASQGVAQMTHEEIRQGFQEHAALTQYYRWYQLYERPEGGLENALDILTENVTVTSTFGTANGHAEYSERVAQLPDTWRNAHHVVSTEITHGEDGSMALSAQVTYQNQGMLPDNVVRQADLTYTVEIVPGVAEIPLLTNVLIEQNDEPTAGEFVDAYANNRMLSLVHYWLALIEDPSRNAEPVREILADDFSLNFSSGVISDFEGFEAWLAGPGSQVVASTHVISNFSAEETVENIYAVTVDFDWSGILPNDAVMIAKTRHNWTVVNHPTERFARIRSIDVEVLEDFRPQGN